VADFFIAVGLIFVIEGLLYALFPTYMKNTVKVLLKQSNSVLQLLGLVAIFIGLVIIYLIK